MKQNLVAFMVLVFLSGGATSCLTDDNSPPTPSPTSSLTSSAASESATSLSGPTEVPNSPADADFGLWIVDLASGELTSLAEGDRYPITRGFSADGELVWVWSREGMEWAGYDREGRVVRRTSSFPPESDAPRCEQTDRTRQIAVVDGTERSVNCGLISPNGQFMLYEVHVDSPNDPGGKYEAWTLDIDTGESFLATDALRHCGGCDSRPSPSWSSSGRYALIPETYAGSDSTTYLHDASARITRAVAVGANMGSGGSLTWSPMDDAYLTEDDVGVFIQRLPDGQRVRLPGLVWPARFDSTGELAYSAGEGAPTVIVDVQTGDVVASWEGAPSVWPIERGVAWTRQGPAALLERAIDCDGTTLHHPSLAESMCLSEAQGAAFDPTVMQFAFARTDGRGKWSVVVFDIATRREAVIATYRTDSYRQPPLIRWSPDSGEVLILWPGPDGI